MYLSQFFYSDKDFTIDLCDLSRLVGYSYSKELFKSLVDGVKGCYADIDKYIDSVSTPIKTVDLNNVLLQILRISVYEGFMAKITPRKVAIDEAIELTRDFGFTESETKKISGILGKLHSASGEE